jgi:hypothetical protein
MVEPSTLLPDSDDDVDASDPPLLSELDELPPQALRTRAVSTANAETIRVSLTDEGVGLFN